MNKSLGGHVRELKNKEKSSRVIPKVIAVAYKNRSLKRAFYYKV